MRICLRFPVLFSFSVRGADSVSLPIRRLRDVTANDVLKVCLPPVFVFVARKANRPSQEQGKESLKLGPAGLTEKRGKEKDADFSAPVETRTAFGCSFMGSDQKLNSRI